MAIYHLNAKVISRGKGKSATAAAAYRAGEKITDLRTGLTFDYSHKKGVDATEIISPENAPDWVGDRSRLWNEVELFENRRNSRLAREFDIALPIEISHAQKQELVRSFVKDQFVSQGLVADVAFHDINSHNPHVHIMLTTRTINTLGFGAKERDLDKKDFLVKLRESWSVHANRILEQAGEKERIDHRTLEEQGINRIPQIHLGADVVAMRERRISTQRGEIYQAIEEANRQIEALENQLAALEKTIEKSSQKATQAEETIQPEKNALPRQLESEVQFENQAVRDFGDYTQIPGKLNYFHSVFSVGRTNGHSATATAALRAGEKIYDQRTGLTFDYSHQPGVVETLILAPEQAPVWVRERETLWNQVEQAEKRGNSKLAQEILLSLPPQLTHEQRLQLVEEYVRKCFVPQGMVADIAFHSPHESNLTQSPHAHVLLTLREIEEQGFGDRLGYWKAWDDPWFRFDWYPSWCSSKKDWYSYQKEQEVPGPYDFKHSAFWKKLTEQALKRELSTHSSLAQPPSPTPTAETAPDRQLEPELGLRTLGDSEKTEQRQGQSSELALGSDSSQAPGIELTVQFDSQTGQFWYQTLAERAKEDLKDLDYLSPEEVDLRVAMYGVRLQLDQQSILELLGESERVKRWRRGQQKGLISQAEEETQVSTYTQEIYDLALGLLDKEPPAQEKYHRLRQRPAVVSTARTLLQHLGQETEKGLMLFEGQRYQYLASKNLNNLAIFAKDRQEIILSLKDGVLEGFLTQDDLDCFTNLQQELGKELARIRALQANPQYQPQKPERTERDGGLSLE